MPADEKAAIRPAIAEAFEAGPEWCATFEDERDKSNWVQVAGELINFGYVGDDDPLMRLSSLNEPAKLLASLETWERGKYATLRVPALDVNYATKLADQIFYALQGCAEGFPINVSLVKLK